MENSVLACVRCGMHSLREFRRYAKNVTSETIKRTFLVVEAEGRCGVCGSFAKWVVSVGKELPQDKRLIKLNGDCVFCKARAFSMTSKNLDPLPCFAHGGPRKPQ